MSHAKPAAVAAKVSDAPGDLRGTREMRRRFDRDRAARARSGTRIHASRPRREMIARPNIGRKAVEAVVVGRLLPVRRLQDDDGARGVARDVRRVVGPRVPAVVVVDVPDGRGDREDPLGAVAGEEDAVEVVGVQVPRGAEEPFDGIEADARALDDRVRLRRAVVAEPRDEEPEVVHHADDLRGGA